VVVLVMVLPSGFLMVTASVPLWLICARIWTESQMPLRPAMGTAAMRRPSTLSALSPQYSTRRRSPLPVPLPVRVTMGAPALPPNDFIWNMCVKRLEKPICAFILKRQV
jgi:hypothetical protein